MSLNPNELYSETTRAAALRCKPNHIQPKNFAQGSGTLAKLTPVAKAKSTGFYQLWASPVSEVSLITPTGTISGGSFKITVEGEQTAAIAWNASAAAILAALVALGGINPEDVSVVGTLATTVTITFANKAGKQAIVVSVDGALLTGGGSIAVSESTAGVGSVTSGVSEIAGFVWPDAVVLDSNEEVIGNVMMSGEIHFDDIPIVAGYTSTQLKEALRNGGVRQLGFTIQGLSGI